MATDDVGSEYLSRGNTSNTTGHRVLASGADKTAFQADVCQLRCFVLLTDNNARSSWPVVITRLVIDDSGVFHVNTACLGK